VRDRVAPARSLGHSDTPRAEPPAADDPGKRS